MDAYIRKAACIAAGNIYKKSKDITGGIIVMLSTLYDSPCERIWQTVINTAGEIAKTDFAAVKHL